MRKPKAPKQPATKAAGSQPVFVATDRGTIRPWSLLDTFALKDGNGNPASQSLPTDRFGAEYGMYGLVAPLYDMDTLAGLLEYNTFHARCCDAKAHDTAGLGMGLQPAKGFKEMNPEEEARVDLFLNKERRHPKPVDVALTGCMMDLESMGVFALEIVREAYSPQEVPAILAHLPANTVRPHHQGNKYMQLRGTQRRWFKRFGYQMDVDKTDGTEYALGSLDPMKRATEVIWHHAYSARSDFYGMPQITPALGAMEGDIAARDYNIDFFRNHGVPAYAIYITGNYNLGELTRIWKETDGTGTVGELYDASQEGSTQTFSNFEYKIITQVRQHLRTLAENPHAPLIMAVPAATPDSKVEIEFKALSVDVKESSFRLYRKDNRDEILTAHGVPPYRIGIAETGSLGGSTATDASRVYRDSVIKPRKAHLAALLNTLVVWDGLQAPSVELYFEDLDLDEEDHEKELADFLFKNAAATPNQLRTAFGTKFGWEAVEKAPALDSYYLNGNLVYSPEPAASDTSTLNGAQVSSLLEVLAAVANKTLSVDSAVAVIERAFQMPPEVARRIIGNPEPPPPAPPVPAFETQTPPETTPDMESAVKGLYDRLVAIAVEDKK